MKYCVTINNKRYEVEVERGNASIVNATEIVIEDNNKAEVQAAATSTVPEKIQSSPEATDEVTNSRLVRNVVKSPIAGAIMEIMVSDGSMVKKGDTLILLESMKMENEITAHVDGIVSEIKVVKGKFVTAGEVLITLR